MTDTFDSFSVSRLFVGTIHFLLKRKIWDIKLFAVSGVLEMFGSASDFLYYLIIVTVDLRFYVSLKRFSLIWRRHHCRWRAAKFKPMLGARGLWAGRDLYRATPAVTRGLGFSGLIRRTAPISRLLWHTWECRGSILTRILTGLLTVAFYDTQGDVEDLF